MRSCWASWHASTPVLPLLLPLSDDLHRPPNIPPDRLRLILCRREQRYVSQQLTLSYDRLRAMLERNEVTVGLAGKYIDTYAFADGGWALWKLPDHVPASFQPSDCLLARMLTEPQQGLEPGPSDGKVEVEGDSY
jgi:hypothetical protein